VITPTRRALREAIARRTAAATLNAFAPVCSAMRAISSAS